MFDKPITIEMQNIDTEDWMPFSRIHATVNKSAGTATVGAGSDQFKVTMNFDVRYSKKLEHMRYAVEPFRIIYKGKKFKVTDYDDYMEQHRKIRLVGEMYE